MATFLALLNFTGQSIRSVKDTTKRAAAAHELAKAAGINMRTIYWTLGQYDLAMVCEGPDDAAMTAFGLALAVASNVRSQTLRALSADEMNGILNKVPWTRYYQARNEKPPRETVSCPQQGDLRQTP